MDLDSVSDEDLGRSLRLCAGSDPTSLPLSAAEGYLLSRIDGHTPWRVLREIGGLSPDEADICIEGWIADGVVEMCTERQKPAPPKPAKSAPTRKHGQIDESQLDDSLEISIDVQRRILEFESGLDRGYFEILGVPSDASAKDIKRAYRELSREFHPDRYFRKEIGGFATRLGDIFKKVLEGYELLSDPATRAEIQKAEVMKPASVTDAPAAESKASEQERVPQAPPKPLTPIERLRQRMPFKIPESLLNERRDRARTFYDSARMWMENGHPLEAASSIRLAIAFDPHAALYKQTFAEIQAGLAEKMARELLSEGGRCGGRPEAVRGSAAVSAARPGPERNGGAAGAAGRRDDDGPRVHRSRARAQPRGRSPSPNARGDSPRGRRPRARDSRVGTRDRARSRGSNGG
jgi:curved DNA-binding protein CbpA